MIKRISLLTATLAICFSLSLMAQQQAPTNLKIHDNEATIVYYMPKTSVSLTIEYDQVEQTKGIFYQYSERYLGTQNVITEDETTYQLRSAHVKTHSTADQQRAYSIALNQQSMAQYQITLTPDGRLLSINTTPEHKEHKCCKDGKEDKCDKKCDKKALLPPMLEDQMQANSIAKMAGLTAKQIYHLREARQSLISGEADHAPADGRAMELSLKALDEQEQALVEMFVGKKTVKHHKKVINIDPTEATTEKVLFRFSKFAGLVDANDLSGEPVFLTIAPQAKQYTPMTEKEAKQQKKALQKQPISGIYYNIPGSAAVILRFEQNTLLEQTFPVAQLGVAVPLPQFEVKKKTPPANANEKKLMPTFRFDPTTGVLLQNGHVE